MESNTTLYIVLPPHLFFCCLWIVYFPPLSYCLPIRRSSSSNPTRFTRSQPPLPVRSAAHLCVDRTCHPPASAAFPCTPLCMPVSAAVPMPAQPPLCRPHTWCSILLTMSIYGQFFKIWAFVLGVLFSSLLKLHIKLLEWLNYFVIFLLPCSFDDRI